MTGGSLTGRITKGTLLTALVMTDDEPCKGCDIKDALSSSDALSVNVTFPFIPASGMKVRREKNWLAVMLGERPTVINEELDV